MQDVQFSSWDLAISNYVTRKLEHPDNNIKLQTIKSKASAVLSIFRQVLLFPESEFRLTYQILKGSKNVLSTLSRNMLPESRGRRVLEKEFYEFLLDSSDFELLLLVRLQVDTLVRGNNLLFLTTDSFTSTIINGQENFVIHIFESKTTKYDIHGILNRPLFHTIQARLQNSPPGKRLFKWNLIEYNRRLSSSKLACSSHSLRALGASLLVQKGYEESFVKRRGNWASSSSFNRYIYALN